MKLLPILNKTNPFHLALSGGVDSLGALIYLKLKEYRFHALHVNHNMIPEDHSIQESVKSICDKLDVPLRVIINEDVHKKGSIEDFGRKCRIKAWNEVGGNIVTAHTLDDAVENYMWNCLRGHHDYVPIQPLTISKNFNILHPFLLTKKEELYKIVKNSGFEEFIVKDPLNEQSNLNRNWIRRDLVPMIHSRNYNLYKVVRKMYI